MKYKNLYKFSLAETGKLPLTTRITRHTYAPPPTVKGRFHRAPHATPVLHKSSIRHRWLVQTLQKEEKAVGTTGKVPSKR